MDASPRNVLTIQSSLVSLKEVRTTSVIRDFVDWSDDNHNLYLNTTKTKEVVVDFRRRIQPAPAPISIQDAEVEVVSSHRYFCVQLDNKLDWRIRLERVCKKGQSQLNFLRRLRSLKII